MEDDNSHKFEDYAKDDGKDSAINDGEDYAIDVGRDSAKDGGEDYAIDDDRDKKNLMGSAEGENVQNPAVNQTERTIELNTCRKLIFGLIIIVLIAVTWVGSTQTSKSTYSPTFSAPYFMVWFTTSWMITCYPLLVPFYFAKVWLLNRSKFTSPSYRFGLLQGTGVVLHDMWKESRLVFSPKGVTFISLLTGTLFFSIVWEATNYSYLRALGKISSTDVTALFSSAPAFVYLFSLCILREPLLILRVISVTMAVGGVVLFMYSEGFSSGNVEGMLLSIAAAIGAAIYKVCLKRRVGDATAFQMGLFLSFLGLFNTLALWPIVMALHFTGVESLDHVPWNFVCSSAGLGLLFNFFINFGIAFTFPIFISFGTILGIPINALVDSFVRKVPFEGWKLTATDFIVGGFMLMLIPISDSKWIHGKIGSLLKYVITKCARKKYAEGEP